MWQNLKDGEERLGEIIEGAAARLIEVELATKELHSEQTEDDDEQEEQQKQGCNRTHRVQQRCHQITERVPVPENGQSESIQSHKLQLTTHPPIRLEHIPGDLEDAEQTYAAKHRDAEG